MNTAFIPAQQATIFDPETGMAHAYRDLPVKLETPGILPKSQHSAARAYFIFWPGGLAAQLLTHRGLNQIQPSTIDALYKKAKHLQPLNERGEA